MEFPHLAKVLEEYAMFLVTEMKAEMSERKVNASGKLAQSIHYILKTENGDYSVSLGLEEYYKWVLKDGRPPTTVTSGLGEVREKIREWIKVKPILPNPNENGELPTPEQLSYLITRKIHRFGYSGTRIWQNAIERTNDKYMERIEEAIALDINDEVDILLLSLKGLS